MIEASIAQLGERKTEDLKVTGSIPVGGSVFTFCECILNVDKAYLSF